MFFTFLLGLAALLVAGSAAYFSVLGIATLFSGSFYQVIVMAGALEFGKLVATSYLYRYWNKTTWFLKVYLLIAVLILMGVTSLGIFGYLSAAYQVNSSKFSQIDSQISLLTQQKEGFDKEIEQINSRVGTLNASRASQEQRLVNLSSRASQPIYKDIEKSGAEIQKLNERVTELQQSKAEKDNQIIELKMEISKAKDIGTFKFVADSINKPLDTVVTVFILILICVFDPLAVSLVLAFNVATRGSVLKEEKEESSGDKEEPVPSEGLKEYEKYQKKIKFSGVTANGSIKN
jgi:cell division protein FtsL